MSDTLAAALVKVQANLPKIAKDAKADTGKYTYRYATLSDVSDAVLPLLAKHGLSFVCMPTVTADGFVLQYRLLHTSGESLDGQYPLPLQGGPQAQGSAITYARRYVLTALVGVAPDDDDGQAAQQAAVKPKQATDPRRLIAERLKQAGVDGQTFADWLKDQHGVDRLDLLADDARIQVVNAVTRGDLLERLKDAG